MRIVVNDVAASPSSGGIYTILMNFYQDIISAGSKKNEWVFLLSGKYVEETENIKVVVLPDLKKSWLKRLWFEFVSGGRYINRLSPDVYLTLQNTATRGVKCRQIVYLQQSLQFFRSRHLFSAFKKSERKMFIYQNLIGTIINSSIRMFKPEIIVQTNWLKRLLVSEHRIDESKVYVSSPTVAVTSETEDSSESTSNTDVKTKFFYPAAAYPYKQHDVLIQACKRLVDAGVTDFEMIFTVNKAELGQFRELPAQIQCVGSLSMREVWEYYRSSVLVFPSLIESYGLPLVEAASCGASIICVELQPQIEVLHGYRYVEYFENGNIDHLCDLMASWVNGSRSNKHKNSEYEWSPNASDDILTIVTAGQ